MMMMMMMTKANAVGYVVPPWRWIERELSAKYANTGSTLIVSTLKIMSTKF